jgi:flagellar biosynthesis protein FliR
MDFSALMRLGLLLARPGMLIVASPGLGGTYAPARIKIGLMVFVAIAMVPAVPLPTIALDAPLPVLLVIARELAIGLAFALAIRVLIGGAELAGHLAGFQTGLAYEATVDPQSGARNPLLVVLYGDLATLTFLMINGHHAFLRALRQSYADLPVGSGGLDGSMPDVVAQLLGILFVVGARLAAPIILVLVVVEIALALVARSAPMLNLMVVAPPVRLIAGLLVLAVIVPSVASLVTGVSGSVLHLAVRAAAVFR